MMNGVRIVFLGLIGLISMPVSAVSTATSSFYIDWSGALFNNQAKAHALLTVNMAEGGKISGYADEAWLFPIVDVVDFSMTVSSAASGNGTFGLSDFDFFMWTSGATQESPLDLSRELIGQATTGGPWGSDFSNAAMTGDFNIFANLELNPFAPNSDGAAFRIATNGGTGDVLTLTSFRPVPLPSAFWMFGPALLALRRLGFKHKEPDVDRI